MSHATRDGRDWQPDFLISIDAKKCIGCGRCFKVCGRDVMTLKGLNEEGELVSLDDDEDDEVEKKIMVMNDEGRLHRLRGLRARLSDKLPIAQPTQGGRGSCIILEAGHRRRYGGNGWSVRQSVIGSA